MSHLIRCALVGVVVPTLTSLSYWASAGTLFIGTDTSAFNGLSTRYLFKATASGPNFVSEAAIPLNFPLNGIANEPGFLHAGDPFTNTLRPIDTNGNQITSSTGGFPNACRNEEQMVAATAP
jgi:hypothetical protein